MKTVLSMPNSGHNSGSTLLAVIVAMVFINLVAAAMLRNTRSQAEAFIGYGGAHSMHGTVNSGLRATETYFAAMGQSALAMLNGAEADSAYYIYGGGGGGKDKVGYAEGRFFNSRMSGFSRTAFTSRIEVNGGKSGGGRSLKKAFAFYKMGNLALAADSAGAFGGSNAIYLGGDLRDGNNGMDVYGDATFEGGVKFQNKPATFRGTVWVGGDIDIPNDKDIRFNDNTYIKGASRFHFMGSGGGHIEPVFLGDVGFEREINMNGGGLTTGGNVWMNGNSVSNMNKDFTSVPTDGAQKSLFTANAMGSWGTGSVVNFNRPAPNGGPYDIPAKLGLDIDKRREPDLDMGKIPGGLIKPASLATGSGMNLSTGRLHTIYDSLKALGQLYNDHVVLSVSKSANINFPGAYDPPQFDKKVIFILEEGARLNAGGRFFPGTQNSSVMVYVKPKAQLDEFGCDGLFRGLIYVDPDNTERQGFKWGDNSMIDGAALLKGKGQMVWNSGSGPNPTKIVRNNDVLSAFGGLVKGADDGGGEAGGTIIFADPADSSIYLTVMGVYFY